jgi:GTP cyclohydrolase II
MPHLDSQTSDQPVALDWGNADPKQRVRASTLCIASCLALVRARRVARSCFRAAHLSALPAPPQLPPRARQPACPPTPPARRSQGPVISTVSEPGKRNAIGAHSGTYSIYRALALAKSGLDRNFRPDFTNTLPGEIFLKGPFPSWSARDRIVSLDPWGHLCQGIFGDELRAGTLDLRPTIAVTRSHLDIPEIKAAIKAGRVKQDGAVISDKGHVVVTKSAVEPVWHLPGVARRFGTTEAELRRILHEQTGGMYPELVSRPDLQLFLPPINGTTVYMIGDVSTIPDPTKPLAVRLHDESGDSDIFGSDDTSCRASLLFGIERCIEAAQRGGAGLVIYTRQEGNALGEVTKFLVYNARKRAGDSVAAYFGEAERVAGLADQRLHELAPDVLHWLGVTRIDELVSDSETKHDVLVASGIEVVKRVGLPAERLGPQAKVEASAQEGQRLEKRRSAELLVKRGSTEMLPPVTRMPSNAARASVTSRSRADTGEPAAKLARLAADGPAQPAEPLPLVWGAAAADARGPVVATLTKPWLRNAIGMHSGATAVHRAVAVAKGLLPADRPLELAATQPMVRIGPHPAWSDPSKIVSLDPWGARVIDTFAVVAQRGVDLQPSIAISRADLAIAEIVEALGAGRLQADGRVLTADGVAHGVKCALEPVWHLPGVAKRFGLSEAVLRQSLFEQTGGIYPELVSRPDLAVFLPPIGGCTIYIFGDPATIPDESKLLTVRVHDECNGSDVFGSDICTCRPYLFHGIEECIAAAQAGGAGVIVYNRKEGRALGEVTKFMVYNSRKRQEGGDTAQNYFKRTEMIAGVQDMRFQEIMPDPLHW